MAKAIRWTVPFQSIKGTNYKINIYDDYTGSVPASWPIVLEPGENPFETQEESSDNFFEAVRPSTGTIEVVDYDGTLMEEIIPINNLHRPVVLVREQGNNNMVEWQGFLSCESYNQDYIGSAQTISINVNSILEVMDYTTIDRTKITNTCRLQKLIQVAMQMMEEKAGISLFSEIYFSYCNFEILGTYITPEVVYGSKEQHNGDVVNSITDDMSLKEVVSLVATAMGCCVREYGSKLFWLNTCHEKYDMLQLICKEYSDFINNDWSYGGSRVDYSIIDMSVLEYMGNTHTRTARSGAKMVEVSSSVGQSINSGVKLPPFPDGYSNTITRAVIEGDKNKTANLIISEEVSKYSHILFNFSKLTEDEDIIPTSIGEFIDDVLTTHGGVKDYCGAIYAKLGITEEGEEFRDADSGVLMQFIRWRNYPSSYPPNIFKFKTESKAVLRYDKLRLSADMTYFFSDATGWKIVIIDKPEDSNTQLEVELWIGTPAGPTQHDDRMYWNGTEWVNHPASFSVSLKGSNFDLSDIPLPNDITLYGYIGFEVHGYRKTARINTLKGIFMKELGVELLYDSNPQENDRSENVFIKHANPNCKDKVSVKMGLMSDMKNKHSTSLLFEDDLLKRRCIYVGYGKFDGEPYLASRRPEVYLLTLLYNYYCKSRTTIELEIKHPDVAPLPLLLITGYDGKTYIPISESRKWQEDTSTLTCMETPDGDE